MDIKCPDSGMEDKNLWENLVHIKPHHEIKFVVASYDDFLWAKEVIAGHNLSRLCPVLISPAWGLVNPEDLVNWILEHSVPCRLNMQLHKYIWSPRKKGV